MKKIIHICFHLLLILVPLILTPWNYELFEFNKMIVVYLLTAVIAACWILETIQDESKRGGHKFFEDSLSEAVRDRKKNSWPTSASTAFVLPRTPLDIPILIFLSSQILSTVFSIDRHVSFFGYYSRFNGGLLSLFCYILLYYAFVTHFKKEDLPSFFKTILWTGFVVSLYGIAEHFGIDKSLWVQDVQNRVFSTLGQPNWLAAYLLILLFISFATLPTPSTSSTFPKIVYFFLPSIYYLTLLFTKSRSAFLAFWIVFIASHLLLLPFFLLIIFVWLKHPGKKGYPKPIVLTPEELRLLWRTSLGGKLLLTLKVSGLFLGIFIILTFSFGSPFSQINRFTAPEIFKPKTAMPKTNDQRLMTNDQLPQPLTEGISESGDIRKIVWQGAIAATLSRPVFGYGVETFAFAYYFHRPKAHNFVSEWDFLYNKAHNEYLNYLATTGFLGLGTYLLMIGAFLWWSFKNIKNQISNIKNQDTSENNKITTTVAFLAAYTSILITNFFGFSVVLVNLFLFLLPAFTFVSSERLNNKGLILKARYQKMISYFLLFLLFYFFIFVLRYWFADTQYAKGKALNSVKNVLPAYTYLKRATGFLPKEPVYHDEFSSVLATLSLAAFQEKNTTLSGQLTTQAIEESNRAVKTSPLNVNFWKTRTRVFYYLSLTNPAYLEKAIEALKIAQQLAPTDPKIVYNLGLLYRENKETDKAIEILNQTLELKPDYRDPRYALALFYKEKGQNQKAKEEVEFILQKINPEDQEAKNLLSTLQ